MIQEREGKILRRQWLRNESNAPEMRPASLVDPLRGTVADSRANGSAAGWLKRRTRVLAALAGGSAAAVIGVELVRIWRLGSMTAERDDDGTKAATSRAFRRLALVLREGVRVTSTHENAVFIMLGSFITTFGIARTVTFSIRTTGRFGPFKDVIVGTRHIHHFVPGALIAFTAGGAAITSRSQELNRWLAVPFGVGLALVLDETALLLELEDVYWAEEGLLSIEVAFGATCLFASLAYLIRVLRRGEAQAREQDWVTAAHAWDQLQQLPGSGRPA